nr:hypothetical protein CFP56_16538 [Quercus suber]
MSVVNVFDICRGWLNSLLLEMDSSDERLRQRPVLVETRSSCPNSTAGQIRHRQPDYDETCPAINRVFGRLRPTMSLKHRQSYLLLLEQTSTEIRCLARRYLSLWPQARHVASGSICQSADFRHNIVPSRQARPRCVPSHYHRTHRYSPPQAISVLTSRYGIKFQVRHTGVQELEGRLDAWEGLENSTLSSSQPPLPQAFAVRHFRCVSSLKKMAMAHRNAVARFVPRIKPTERLCGRLKLHRQFSTTLPRKTDGVFRALTDQRVQTPWVEAFRKKQREGMPKPSGQSETPKDRDLTPKKMTDSYHSVVRTPGRMDQY